MTRRPCLVIWSLETLEAPSAIQLEVRRLQEYWRPAPILLLLPKKLKLNTKELLQFECPGLLQDPSLETLLDSMTTLIGGGRVVRLKNKQDMLLAEEPTMGLGQWLLISGLQQINNEIERKASSPKNQKLE